MRHRAIDGMANRLHATPMNRKAVLVCLVMAFIGISPQVWAQDDSAAPASDVQLLTDVQLDQIAGPIALYPDPLISEILPAATQPEQIAMAYTYVMQGGDPNGIDSQPWDDSVKAVAHYPDIIKMMDGDLSWTTQLGDAFVNQPSDVMNSIQRLRTQAQDLGNLQSTPQEEVDTDDGDIEILPSDPNEVYIPTYDPGLVYYQRCYGAPFITFGVGFGIGLWLNHDFDWHNHNLFVWGRDHPRPANYWHERPADRHAYFAHAEAWHPAANRIEHRAVGYNRGFVSRGIENRGAVDRGYEPRVAAPRSSVEVHTIPARETVRENVNVHVAAPEVRVSAPRVSVFTGEHSAVETRASSSRGMESRAAAGGGAHYSGGGGGGGGHAPSGGGGGGKR
jgi:Protein of unknown function (DUF3300)